MLLARAEGETHGGIAGVVLGHAHEAARHLAFEGVLGGEEPRVRPAEAERHAETLRGADGDVRTKFAGRPEQREREQVGGRDGERAGGVGGGEEIRKVMHAARRVGVLHEDAEAAGRGLEFAPVAHDDLEPEGFRPRPDDIDRLGVAGGVDEEAAVGGGIALLEPVAHHHGLGGGGALVEHRGVGDLEAGEIADHRLEIEQRLEPALRDLGLVGRVGGIPAGILEDVALDDSGHVRVGIAHADQATKNLVLRGNRAQLRQRGALAGGGGQVERAAPDVRRHRGVHQRVERRVAEELEHLGRGGGIIAVVAAGKGIGEVEQITRRRHSAKLGRTQGRATAFWLGGGQLRVCFEPESRTV